PAAARSVVPTQDSSCSLALRKSHTTIGSRVREYAIPFPRSCRQTNGPVGTNNDASVSSQKEKPMDRRQFTTVMGAVVAGMAAGAKVFGADAAKSDAGAPADKHVCKGKNDCKGKGGCKGGDAGCAGKNSCKGKGGCNVPVKADHMDKAKSSCSGKNGCKGV